MAINAYIANPVSQTITDGVTNKAPSENAVHDALELKVDITSLPSNLTLYPTSTASDIPTYFKMVTNITDPDYDSPAVDFVTGSITGAAQLLGSLATTSGILTGNPGILPNVTTIGNIKRNSGTGTAEFYFEVYHRDSLGTETLIGTSSVTNPVSNATYEEFSSSLVWNNGDFDPTDRIVIKWYANRIAGGSNPVYAFQLGGATPVRTVVPVPASVLLDVPIQIGVTEIVDGTTGTLLRNEGGVIGDTDYTVPKTDGSAGQVLQTNGSGVATWQTVGGGLTIGTTAITSGTVNRILFEGAGNVVSQDSQLTFDGSTFQVQFAGATSGDVNFKLRNSAGTANFFEVRGDSTYTLGPASLTKSFQYLADGRLFMAESGTNFIELNPSTTNNRFYLGSHGLEVSTLSSTKVIELRTPNTAIQMYGGTMQLSSSLNASDGTNVFSVTNGTAPSVNYLDSFKIYSADQTAGNACFHSRSENGDIQKIYSIGGWGTPIGTLTRTTFDESTVTLPQLAQRVAALITDLKTGHQLLKA